MARFEFLLTIAVISLLFSSKCHADTPSTIKAAYFPSWAPPSFSPSNINSSIFTHIYYAFVIPSHQTNKLNISDSESAKLTDFTATLRRKNPPVKSILSIGGGLQIATDIFTPLVRKSESRKTLIDSAIDTARKLGFDGLDLDWENPQSVEEMEYLRLLVEEWRKAIISEAAASRRSPLLLTAAFQCSAEIIWPTRRSYPVQSLNINLDWINAMCYDFHGQWENFTGAPAALYDPNSNLSTSYGLNSWAQAGMDKKKILVGIPLYGRTWTLADPNVYKIGSEAVGPGPTDDPSDNTLTYPAILQFNKMNNATVVYDVATGSTYSYTRHVWIGYDDARSVAAKVNYTRSNGFRGYFLWALSFDNGWELSQEAALGASGASTIYRSIATGWFNGLLATGVFLCLFGWT